MFPTAAFALLVSVIYRLHFDLLVSDLFYDPTQLAFPARSLFWYKAVLHNGGNRLMVVFAVVTFGVYLASFGRAALRSWRRGSGYVLLCLCLVTGVVALGKAVTEIDCPWSLARYGGDKPYVRLFDARPPGVVADGCFPGAHSSGAFALFAFYFLWRDRRPRWARRALVGAAVLGGLFALTQWIRGAHFVSHDLWSAWLAWIICLGVYRAFGGPHKSISTMT